MIKQFLQHEYKDIDKSVKRKTRRDKRVYIDKLAEEAQDAANRGNTRTIYGIIRKLSGGVGRSGEGPIKDKTGAILISDEEKKAQWAEHFHETLNRLPPVELLDFSIYKEAEALPIALEEITLEEIKKAIKGMKNHKAAGEGNIAAELDKANSDENLISWLRLYNCVWKTEKMQSDWRKGTIVNLPKKGDLSDCNNCRGITLLSVPGKIFCSILLNRIRSAVERVPREEQAGFRPGRSCIDQIFALINILEQSNEW